MKTTTQATRPKGYSYVRFSTADQVKGDSLRRQTEAAERWCQSNNVELVTSYRDLGISAWKGKNSQVGALGAFLKIARAGRIEKGSFLIIESLDRLSRADVMSAFDQLRSILEAGIKVVTLSDGGRVYDAEKIRNGGFVDLIVAITVMSRANEESQVKSQRVSAAWANKRKGMGEHKLTAKCPGWLRLSADRKSFDLIPARVAVVQRIFELAAAGKGVFAICKLLRSERVPTFGGDGAFWSVPYVSKLLCSRRAIGEFQPAIRRDGKKVFLDAVPGYYPAVVSLELFATVAQTRKIRPAYKGRSAFNVFAKLAFDRQTGCALTYSNKDRARGWHYLVPYSFTTGKCDYASWQYDDFLASFLGVTEKASLSKAPAVERDNSALIMARQELDDADGQIGRLVDALSRGGSLAVESKMRDLEAQKVEIEARISDIESAAVAAPKDCSLVDWTDAAALRENLRATVKRITVDCKARWFKAEFLDGRVYEFQRHEGGVTITTD